MPVWAFFIYSFESFCDIITSMIDIKKSLFSVVMLLLCAPAFAGWQYDGYYVDDGYYEDDGSRFTVSLRGGLSLANAKMKNDVGNLDTYYYINPTSGAAVSLRYFSDADEAASNGFTEIAVGNISNLPVKKDFSKTAFTAGASVGFTVPNHSQWRLEAGYDYIAETEYNQVPLFEGTMQVTGEYNGTIHVSSSGVTSTISTDVFSAMVYYDFFDGNKKELNKLIPYIGLGVGYAASRTTMKLSDIYGDLSTDSDLLNYGTADSSGIIRFDAPSDASKYPTSRNVAAIGAIGASYGISKYTFLDFSARVMYIPTIKWNLVNSDGTQHREWFSAEDMIYTNLMIGLRFEF